MNDQEFEIINRETKKQKTIDFVKKNKNIFFVLILSIIFCVIGYFSYEMYLNNKRSNLANKFNNSVNSHKIGNNENILGNMVEIINSNDKTYSPLALYYLLDNNLISSIHTQIILNQKNLRIMNHDLFWSQKVPWIMFIANTNIAFETNCIYIWF